MISTSKYDIDMTTWMNLPNGVVLKIFMIHFLIINHKNANFTYTSKIYLAGNSDSPFPTIH